MPRRGLRGGRQEEDSGEEAERQEEDSGEEACRTVQKRTLRGGGYGLLGVLGYVLLPSLGVTAPRGSLVG